jgi:hypothetical protein
MIWPLNDKSSIANAPTASETKALANEMIPNIDMKVNVRPSERGRHTNDTAMQSKPGWILCEAVKTKLIRYTAPNT